MLKMARELQRTSQLKSLCMAGGVALNSVANGRIQRETAFQDIFIHPAAGDSGGAVGAALYAWHVLLGNKRRYVMENAYLGEGYTDSEIRDRLTAAGVPFQGFDDDDKLLQAVTDQLLNGKVIGWFQGRFEWGPRALGNRSIIADPRRVEMKELVNSKIKFREPFRPFAPVVPESCSAGLFDDLTRPEQSYPLRFMLLVYPWQRESGQRVPAVNHRGTGRLQTLRREWNPRYYGLLECFSQATGTPVLMNTSFNLRGEPIVSSPEDALNTFRLSGLDSLVLGNCVVGK